MALIKCSECNAEISDKAAACVNCGAPVEKRSKRNTTSLTKKIVIGFFAIAVLNIVAGLAYVLITQHHKDTVINETAGSDTANNQSQTVPQSNIDQQGAIGIWLADEASPSVIEQVFPGAAADAGIKKGDQILSINGTPTAGKSLKDILSLLTGSVGSPVMLEWRSSNNTINKQQLVRRVAKGTLIYPGKGYMRTDVLRAGSSLSISFFIEGHNKNSKFEAGVYLVDAQTPNGRIAAVLKKEDSGRRINMPEGTHFFLIGHGVKPWQIAVYDAQIELPPDPKAETEAIQSVKDVISSAKNSTRKQEYIDHDDKYLTEPTNKLIRCMMPKLQEPNLSSHDGGKSAAHVLSECPEETKAFIDACIQPDYDEKGCMVRALILPQFGLKSAGK